MTSSKTNDNKLYIGGLNLKFIKIYTTLRLDKKS